VAAATTARTGAASVVRTEQPRVDPNRADPAALERGVAAIGQALASFEFAAYTPPPPLPLRPPPPP